MIDNLADVCKELGNEPRGKYYTNVGGYCTSDGAGLDSLNAKLKELGTEGVELVKN